MHVSFLNINKTFYFWILVLPCPSPLLPPPPPPQQNQTKLGRIWGDAVCETGKETAGLEMDSAARHGLWEEQGRGWSVGKEGKKIADRGMEW